METDFRKTGFRFEGDEVEFYCEPDGFSDLAEGESVFVAGTFNAWLTTADSSWRLAKKISKNKVYFSLKKPASHVMIPGNTGFPEFKFFAISNTSYHLLTENFDSSSTTFETNKLIFQTQEDFDIIQEIINRPDHKKSLSDFDLTCPACRSDISNVRVVPGTNCLLRGYNPFKRSKNEFDTETTRIALAQKAYEIYNVNCDITLNGFEGASTACGEEMPEIIKKINAMGNRLCINIDYNLVYFHPDAVDYSVALRKIALFIIEREGPYFIHCRLGSDRTGVTCAIFAALCGASWKDIVHDYERTANMGVGEYRNRKLLQYSLGKMLRINPADAKDLAHAMQSYFIKENILKMEEISRLIERLQEPLKTDETNYFDFNEKHICAKKNANIK